MKLIPIVVKIILFFEELGENSDIFDTTLITFVNSLHVFYYNVLCKRTEAR